MVVSFLTESSVAKKIINCILKFFLVFITLLVFVFVGLLGAISIINLGPSKHARDLFVVSVMETSGVQFLAKWFFSDKEIDKIINNNSLKPVEDKTDANLITVHKELEDEKFDKNKIEVVDVISSKYKGKMLIVNDPSRVFVGTIPTFGDDLEGMTVTEIAKSHGCIAATNAGGFLDIDGVGKGGMPIGIVISQGVFKCGSKNTRVDMCGFDKDHKLHVGYITGQEAINMGIRDAVSYGPTLIVNGKPAVIKGTAGGWNPRTAIGQRADGAVLLLVIDGRQTTSIGATYADLIREMKKFKAVNAYNLDGGTSSHMIYKNKIITNCSSLYGTRDMPTAILVKGDR